MPDVVSDIVDVYVFRRLNARVQFLLLQRRVDVALGQTWQSFHTQIQRNESTLAAARRAVLELSGLNISTVYSADYINQFYDDVRDVLVLAPVIAVNVSPQAPVQLGAELRDCAWLDRDEATARLPFTGQRWAVRHIDEIMSIGDAESELYRLHLPPLTEVAQQVEPPDPPPTIDDSQALGSESAETVEIEAIDRAPVTNESDEDAGPREADDDRQRQSRSYVHMNDG
jgi:dATP pyrophosphohydrolase